MQSLNHVGTVMKPINLPSFAGDPRSTDEATPPSNLKANLNPTAMGWDQSFDTCESYFFPLLQFAGKILEAPPDWVWSAPSARTTDV